MSQCIVSLCKYEYYYQDKVYPLENLKDRFEEAFYNQFGFNHLNVKIIVENAVIHYSRNESSPELSRTRTETKSKNVHKYECLLFTQVVALNQFLAMHGRITPR